MSVARDDPYYFCTLTRIVVAYKHIQIRGLRRVYPAHSCFGLCKIVLETARIYRRRLPVRNILIFEKQAC